MTTYPLDTVCEVLKMHPQTVWRALGLNADYGDWQPTKNPDIVYDAVAFAYGLSESNFKRCLLHHDTLMTVGEIAELLKIPHTLVRSRCYPLAVRRPYCVRFLLNAVMERHRERYLDADGKKSKKR